MVGAVFILCPNFLDMTALDRRPIRNTPKPRKHFYVIYIFMTFLIFKTLLLCFFFLNTSAVIFTNGKPILCMYVERVICNKILG